MKQKLNLETWNRKEHFLFFKQMEEPFFGITVTIDCTNAYAKSKELGVSFFTYYLHKTLVAVNKIEPFRYRILENEIYIFDRIDASATILRDDKTFGFSQIEFAEDILQFAENTKNEIARIQTTTGLLTREFSENLIHFSALPWINFTSFSHARSFTFPDSCPKISFGKMIDENDKKTMSMSVHVHHGLMDGYHLGEYVNLFQEVINT
ncbi:MAG: chloramphenicol acetyltransferase [Flavobacteriaceae bacterium]|nr:chloramphenicol acetyltransferase [Flavobacteriaceae bacterium]